MRKIADFAAKQPKRWVIAEALMMTIAVGIIDYLTGYEVTIFPFYSIGILFALWLHNTRSAIVMAIISAFFWWWSDTASGHHYSREWLQIWDAVVRFIFFLLVVLSGYAVRSQRDSNRTRIELLERSQELEREIITISEREQQRIGRDLHDGLGQYLVGIGMAADSLKDDMDRERWHGTKQMERITGFLHEAVIRTRNLSRGLSPVDGDEGGLEAALEDLTSSASQLSGIKCSFICDGYLPVMENERAVHLFRIAQEALGNAVKHAHPKLIVIALESGENGISLRISDDGTGVNPEPAKKGKGMGFNIMRYRVRMLGGTLDIQRNLPTGTVVTCSIHDSATPPQTDL